MYELFVEDHFDAAHYLPEYQGKCERLHGHRFKVLVRVTAAGLDRGGMAYDFAEMKRVLREALAVLDHNCLNELPDFATTAPSSENIAAWLYSRLEPGFGGTPVKLLAVEVWESPTAGVVYRP
jgi:6-pyruvoyltetrahydropterin/6-carboxytetrahydropterin synthase